MLEIARKPEANLPPPQRRQIRPQSQWRRNSLAETATVQPTSTAHSSSNLTTKSIHLTGIRIDCMTEAEVVARLMSDLQQGRGGWVLTLNVDILRLMRERPELRKLSDKMSLVVADGMPLVWASRLQGTPLAARIPGSSLILSLSAAAARSGSKILLLGGSRPVAEKAAVVLTQENPGLRIAGILCPPLGFDQDPASMAALRKALIEVSPDLVYVCLGSPKEIYVIRELRKSLPSTWFLGLGGSVDIISGEIRRAPIWMQRAGLEWSWRLMMEPRRLFKRYIIHDFPFATRLLISAIRNRKQPRREFSRSEHSNEADSRRRWENDPSRSA